VAEQSERAAKRYLKLIEELGDELGAPKHGWKSAVARALGMDQSYISKILSRERMSIGVDAVESAVRHLRLDRDYFWGPREPRSYRDYLTKSPNDGPPYPAWYEFLDSVAGKSLTADERATLASARFAHGEPTTQLYEGWLFLLRNMLTAADLPLVVTATQSVDAKIAAKRRKKRKDAPDR
jgi:hypothetical protein